MSCVENIKRKLFHYHRKMVNVGLSFCQDCKKNLPESTKFNLPNIFAILFCVSEILRSKNENEFMTIIHSGLIMVFTYFHLHVSLACVKYYCNKKFMRFLGD